MREMVVAESRVAVVEFGEKYTELIYFKGRLSDLYLLDMGSVGAGGLKENLGF